MLYQEYQDKIENDIEECFKEMKSQPIIFVGSGFSRRYFNAPTWLGLIESVCNNYNFLDKDFAYYSQKFNTNPIEIASSLIEQIHTWAWEDGKEIFPSPLFSSNIDKSVFLKFLVAEYLKNITPNSIDEIRDFNLLEELKILKQISPHAIITTNYDQFLEKIFTEYEPVIGQKILKNNFSSIGEIYKIHGCISEPESLVIINKDYENFQNKQKYLTAKLFTYFVEHPLFFIGYSASDPNIKEILSNIDEMLSNKDGIIPNIYIISWDQNIEEKEFFEPIKSIRLANDKEIKVKNIITSNFQWIYKILSQKRELHNINVKILRSLMARVYTLVKTDIPNNTQQISYTALEDAVKTEKGIPTLLGITLSNNFSTINQDYPYRLSEITNKLGLPYWNHTNKLFDKIVTEKEIDIKQSNNQYHLAIKNGKTIINKYSEKCYELLEKVKNNEEYTIEI